MVPRSNRRRDDEEYQPLDPDRLLAGWKRLVVKRDGEWHVQPMTGANAVKVYVCPGCGGEIAVGTPHLVAWRADGILGEADDLAGRRHWHTRCWEIRL